MLRPLFGSSSIVLMLAMVLQAQEAKEPTEEESQKKIVEQLKRIDYAKATIHDGPDFRIVSTVPADKLKSVSAAAQKYYDTAEKAMKFDEKEDRPWKGKLNIFVLAERSSYTAFVRTIEQRRVLPDEDYSISVRTEPPHVAFSLNGKETPAQLEAEIGGRITLAMLMARAGPTADLPSWMKDGFARAIRMRLDPSWGATERAAIRRLMVDPKVLTKTSMPAKLAHLSNDEREPKDRDRLATSMMEYLVYGPDGAKVSGLLTAFRPSEEVPRPTFEGVLKAMEKTPEAVEKAWKKWALTGK